MRKGVEKLPLHCKQNLTIQEAAEYSNIGEKRLAALVSDPRCTFALFVGNKRLIKRRLFDEYIESVTML